MSVFVMPFGMANVMICAHVMVATEFMWPTPKQTHEKLADQQRPPDGGTDNVKRFHDRPSRVCADPDWTAVPTGDGRAPMIGPGCGTVNSFPPLPLFN